MPEIIPRRQIGEELEVFHSDDAFQNESSDDGEDLICEAIGAAALEVAAGESLDSMTLKNNKLRDETDKQKEERLKLDNERYISELKQGKLPVILQEKWKLVPFESPEGQAFHHHVFDVMKEAYDNYREYCKKENIEVHHLLDIDFDNFEVQFLLSKSRMPNAWRVSHSQKPNFIVVTQGYINQFVKHMEDLIAVVGHELTHAKLRAKKGEIKNTKAEEEAANRAPLDLLYADPRYNPERVLPTVVKMQKISERCNKMGVLIYAFDPHVVPENRVSLMETYVGEMKFSRGELKEEDHLLGALAENDPLFEITRAATFRSRLNQMIEVREDEGPADITEFTEELCDQFFELEEFGDVLFDYFLEALETNIEKRLESFKDNGAEVKRKLNEVWEVLVSKFDGSKFPKGLIPAYRSLSNLCSKLTKEKSNDGQIPIGIFENLNHHVKEFIRCVEDNDEDEVTYAAEEIAYFIEDHKDKFQGPWFQELLLNIDFAKFSPRQDNQKPWLKIMDIARENNDVLLSLMACGGILDIDLVAIAVDGCDFVFDYFKNIVFARSPEALINNPGPIITGHYVNKHKKNLLGMTGEDEKKNFEIYSEKVTKSLKTSIVNFIRTNHLLDNIEDPRWERISRAYSEMHAEIYLDDGVKRIIFPELARSNVKYFVRMNKDASAAADFALSALIDVAKKNPNAEVIKLFFQDFQEFKVKFVYDHKLAINLGKQGLNEHRLMFKRLGELLSLVNSLLTDEEKILFLEEILQCGEVDGGEIDEKTRNRFKMLDQAAGLNLLEDKTEKELIEMMSRENFISNMKGLSFFEQEYYQTDLILKLTNKISLPGFLTACANLHPEALSIDAYVGSREILGRLKDSLGAKIQKRVGTLKNLEQVIFDFRLLEQRDMLHRDVVSNCVGILLERIQKIDPGKREKYLRQLHDTTVINDTELADEFNEYIESGKASKRISGGNNRHKGKYDKVSTVKIADLEIRKKYQQIYVEEIMANYGSDDGSEEYFENLQPCIDWIFGNFPLNVATELLDQLSTTLNIQSRLCHYIDTEINENTERVLIEENLVMSFIDCLLAMGKRLDETKATIVDFLIKGTQYTREALRDQMITLAPEEAKAFSGVGSGESGLGEDQGERGELTLKKQLDLTLDKVYENFWGLPMTARIVVMKELFGSAEDGNVKESDMKLCLSRAIDDKTEDADAARKFLKEYISALPSYQKYLGVSAMLVAGKKSAEKPISLGESLAVITENLGPLETKIGQRAGSHPSVPKHLKEGLKRLKYNALKPLRWRMMKQLMNEKEDLIKDYCQRNGISSDGVDFKVGEILGSGSVYVAVEIKMNTGEEFVVALKRPFVEQRGISSSKTFDVLIGGMDEDDKRRAPLSEMNHAAGEKLKIEANCLLAEHQYQWAEKCYGDAKVIVGDEEFIFHPPKVVAQGDRFFVMEKVEGDHILAVEDLEYKRRLNKALVAIEFSNVLQGQFECDRHGGNGKIAVKDSVNVIGPFDFKGFDNQKWQKSDYDQLAKVVFAVIGETNEIKSIVEEFDKVETEIRKSGEVSHLVTAVKELILSMGEFINDEDNPQQAEEDFQAAMMAVFQTGACAEMKEALVENAPDDMRAMIEMMVPVREFGDPRRIVVA